ncbi:MAG TPA: hypothetical protein VJ142_02740 [Candidatus Nanoarchaeia archaeon]|nr:hypothetical protein [Candidatus Nanoarchaeia archaeon]
MGLFRGGTVLILGILLFSSFLIMNSFFILSSSLKYENVKAGLYPLVTDISGSGTGGLIPKEIVGEFNLTDAAEDALRFGKFYCRNQNNTQYSFNYEGYNVNISCETIINSTSSESLINETYGDVIYDIYYKEYDCSFWRCFSKTGLPFFLVSEKAHDYWQSKFYFSLAVSLILIALIFLLVEQKINTPIIVGALLALSAFPLLKLKDLLYAIAGNFAALINIFLSSTRSIFLFSLIAGIFLAGAGIGLRLLRPDLIKKKFSMKDVKEIVKGEIAMEKEKQAQEQRQKTKGKKK